MKTIKFCMGIISMLCFLALNDLQGQWLVNGTAIYNTNTGNVGISNGGLWAPTHKLHINTLSVAPAGVMAESFYNGTSTRVVGYYRITNTLNGDLFNLSLRRSSTGQHEMLQSCFINGFGWAEYNYFNYSTRKFEMRSGILDAEFKNSGDFLLNNSGRVGIDVLPDGHGLNVINYASGKAAVQGLNQSQNLYAAGMLGVLSPTFLGVPVYVVNAGVLGIKPNAGSNGAAVYGWNNDVNSLNYGGVFAADGAATTAGYTNFGVYGLAKNASINYAGRFFGRVEVDGHANSTDAVDYLSTVFSAQVNHTLSTDSRAVEGISEPAPGYGIGVSGTGGYEGVLGIANGSDYSGWAYGVVGSAGGSAGTRVGVYGAASGGTTNWAGYFAGDCYINSDLRIATTTQATGYALSVNGKIACEEVLVEDMVSWPDYVFNEDYNLMSLEELEKSIGKSKHLPGIPSAAEIEENGLSLGDMQKRMIEKIEELTLYTIQQNKMIKELQEKMEKLEIENNRLRKSADQ
jgi:hypothetical protein